MGNCCVTSGVKPPPHSHPAANSNRRTASPPLDHPLPEEETVKEVLSETPTLLPKLPVDDGPHKNPPLPKDQENRQNDVGLTKAAAAAAADAVDSVPDDLSEGFSGSEICSTLSESVPATAASGKLDDVTQRSPASVLKGPFPGEARRERISEPSPGRVRSGAGRGSSGRPSGNVPRKGSPEKIGRRSVSPATRTGIGGAGTGLGRTPSMRKSGKSPGRVRSDMSDKIRMLEGSFKNHNNGGQKWESTKSKESLENPLVSLECFIFL
ncbi:unnamed protein product [Cuscuta campestris]|uniref:Uncharacterized protein n=1 Tax=Cuscuta campestris TaxID=132261 RepID=A0A484ML16_9ASTE|nr:unnamed protein product [Cuscuta campestris]